METDKIKKVYEILNKIPVTEDNEDIINDVKDSLLNEDFVAALEKIQNLQLEDNSKIIEEETDELEYPEELSNFELEETYMGLLLNDPKLIVKYNFLFKECYFESPEILNLYKSVLFTEGGNYTPEPAKKGFNFAIDTEESHALKKRLKKVYTEDKYNMERTYIELRKLFVLRKNYLEMPIKEIQRGIVEITSYVLYKDMTEAEVESAIRQVSDTSKFKKTILNHDLTQFLKLSDNNLTNGLSLPFPIISYEYKGIRKGETMAWAMPSNAGKSRFTTNLAAHVAFVHRKKVLLVSNEMSEEKMKLCLITTLLNNPEIQKRHGQMLRKTEGELLEFKFRPDMGQKVKVDNEGFALKEPKETQEQFVERLKKVSTEYNRTIAVTDWVNKELNNSIYFVNITDHTNDELQKVIMNYYYKYKIEYFFYDTLKTDTANIGIAEEIKKTTTILTNLAQNFNLFICATLQLAESKTLPINLDVNDLSVSRTVKEVLDTLGMMKQINRENWDDYEYSLKEVDTNFFNIEKTDDPFVRYYACVIDKNRAGGKPKLLFKINLAYNSWEELGYLRLKQQNY